LGGESKGKEPRRVHVYIPHQIPKRKVSKPPQENHQEKALKMTKKENREELKQALRNHAKSSILPGTALGVPLNNWGNPT
jgi:hypothetical protein